MVATAVNGLVRGGFKVRQASHNDADAIAELRLQAWRETYSDVFAASLFERQQAHLAQSAEAIRVSMDKGGYHWLVVDRSGDIAGWAHAGAARDDHAPTPLELHAIYLLRPAQGTGIADRLLLTAIGDADCYLWVIEGNQRRTSISERVLPPKERCVRSRRTGGKSARCGWCAVATMRAKAPLHPSQSEGLNPNRCEQIGCTATVSQQMMTACE